MAGITLCPRQIFLLVVGASGNLNKPLTESKKPMVKRVKVEIVNYIIFISLNLSCKFNSALPLNYISERCFGAMSFTLANSNIWSVKKLQAIINLSFWKFVETQLFRNCKTHVFLKKIDKILLMQLYIFMSALSYQFCYLSYPFLEVNYPGKKIPAPQTIINRRIIINQIASNSVFYNFLPS